MIHCQCTLTSLATAFLCHHSCLLQVAQPSMYTAPYWPWSPWWTTLLIDGWPYLVCIAKLHKSLRSVTESARNIAMRLKPFQNDLIGGFAVSLVCLLIRRTKPRLWEWLFRGHGYRRDREKKLMLQVTRHVNIVGCHKSACLSALQSVVKLKGRKIRLLPTWIVSLSQRLIHPLRPHKRINFLCCWSPHIVQLHPISCINAAYCFISLSRGYS